jgi:hypothetical protein
MAILAWTRRLIAACISGTKPICGKKTQMTTNAMSG